MAKDRTFHIRESLAGQTLAAALRRLVPALSWNDAKRRINTRHVQVNGNLTLDDGRRLKAGDVIKLFETPRAPVPTEQDVRVRHVDPDLVVVEKPAGMTTLRHAEERQWDERRRQKQPTLEETLQRMLPRLLPQQPPHPPERGRHPLHRGKKPARRPPPPRAPRQKMPRVRPVHRLDRDTSGLMVFALSPRAEQKLVEQFKEHEVRRTYVAVVTGRIDSPRTIESWLVRDRGDGLRGSSPLGKAAPDAKHAVTHVRPVEHLGDACTVVECRLETGRTHQIRIHLAESGHMLCGEKTYTRPAPGAPATRDPSGAPRHALHSTTLEFVHPVTGRTMRFEMPWPGDLAGWLKRLRSRAGGSSA